MKKPMCFWIFTLTMISLWFGTLSFSLYAAEDPSASTLLAEASQALDSASRELESAVGEYNAALEKMEEDAEAMEANLNDQGDPRVMIRLTYPAGQSPKVFTRGWVFGAEAMFNPKPEDEESGAEDISDQVKWEGTGTFNPGQGARSHPSFSGEGDNTIVLSVTIDGTKITKTVHVNAVSPALYARLGSLAHCPADGHGSPGDPLPVTGPVQTGSTLVMIDGKPAARVGDTGVHAECSGPNTFTIVEGDPEVLIEGKPAARKGYATKHCGGMGTIIQV